MKHYSQECKSKANIILGGVGDDTHNIGLVILGHLLRDRGFNVTQMGAQTSQEEFIDVVSTDKKVDALVILSYSGHAEQNIVGLKKKCMEKSARKVKFYIGGLLTISDDSPYDIKHRFISHGFDRVYTTHNKFEDIIADLCNDFSLAQHANAHGSLKIYGNRKHKKDKIPKNTKWSLKKIFNMRKKVLNSWETGRDVGSLKNVADYQLTIPKNKRYSYILDEAIQKKRMLIQPRGGVSIIENHIRLLELLESSGSDLLPTTVDSYTRKNEFKMVASALKRRISLNGFPIVNHGVEVCRRVTEQMNIPVQVRHGTPDARLLAEISFAGGFTAFEGGAICYTLPYSKKANLGESITYWQYIDRLTGLLEERGIRIHREFYGALTGFLIEPSISHSIGIIEAILAAKQGVKHMSLSYAENGNLIQDIAAVKTLKFLAEEYLGKMGFKNLNISTVFYQYMGPFPKSLKKAKMLITNSAYVAALSGANKIVTKTVDEAYKIPTAENNANAVSIVRKSLNSKNNPFSELPLRDINNEMSLIAEETRSILDTVIRLGKGDVATGVMIAFKKGVLDVPFAPNVCNQDKVRTIYDSTGSVRFYDTGDLPFNKSIKDFHKSKVEQRAVEQNKKLTYSMVLEDIQRIVSGSFDKWPTQSIT